MAFVIRSDVDAVVSALRSVSFHDHAGIKIGKEMPDEVWESIALIALSMSISRMYNNFDFAWPSDTSVWSGTGEPVMNPPKLI